jgi:hypothetical protein
MIDFYTGPDYYLTGCIMQGAVVKSPSAQEDHIFGGFPGQYGFSP